MCSLVGGTIAENFVKKIRTDKVRPFRCIRLLLNIQVYRKDPGFRSILLGLVRILGLVCIRHDEEATTGCAKHNHHYKSRIYPSENYRNNIYLIGGPDNSGSVQEKDPCSFLTAEKV